MNVSVQDFFLYFIKHTTIDQIFRNLITYEYS